MIFLGDGEAETTEIVWITEKTTRSPGVVPEAVRARVEQLSDIGGGRLAVHAVGSRARHVVTTDLDITQDGDKVADEAVRRAAIETKLDDVEAELDAIPVGDTGFSLYAALRTAADEVARVGKPVEVWLSTTVLSGSADPLSIPSLTSAEVDPSQAVDELMKGSLRDLDLSGVRLKLVLLTPVGEDQADLGPRAESWRATFITELTAQLGASPADPLRDNETMPPWHDAAVVPAIVPMADRTPEPPPVPEETVPAPPRIDNAAFYPDTAELVDPKAARRAVGQVVRAYQDAPGRYRITVVGYCSRYGDADGARETSKQRALTISRLLQEEGIPPTDIVADGKGYDERAVPNRPPQDPAQRVVVIRLVTR